MTIHFMEWKELRGPARLTIPGDKQINHDWLAGASEETGVKSRMLGNDTLSSQGVIFYMVVDVP